MARFPAGFLIRASAPRAVHPAPWRPPPENTRRGGIAGIVECAYVSP
ncbi:MAG: hypothetical protein OXU61_00990 [Gammaproteobacteria bacterium]|nr:hypothetical protein [Gammaproteobacteria bacterium]